MAPGQRSQALLTMLYRSTDRLCRCGAAVENLAHSASFQSLENNAPSNPGIKHLGWGPFAIAADRVDVARRSVQALAEDATGKLRRGGRFRAGLEARVVERADQVNVERRQGAAAIDVAQDAVGAMRMGQEAEGVHGFVDDAAVDGGAKSRVDLELAARDRPALG